MQNLNDLLDLANSLEWFELETDEQQILTNLETSVSLIHRVPGTGYYQTPVTDRAEWGQYSHAIQADTLDGLESMIFDHYEQVVNQLALNEYR